MKKITGIEIKSRIRVNININIKTRRWKPPVEMDIGADPHTAPLVCQNAKTVLQTDSSAPEGRKSHNSRCVGPSLRVRVADLKFLRELQKSRFLGPGNGNKNTNTDKHNSSSKNGNVNTNQVDMKTHIKSQ